MSMKIYFQNMIPGTEIKKRRLFYCYWSGDFLWHRLEAESVSVHGIS